MTGASKVIPNLSRSIIYQSEDKNVTLIDIPYSIAAAQGFEEDEERTLLMSCHAVEVPFPQPDEPRSKKAKADLVRQICQEEDARYQSLIGDALASIRNAHSGDWCFPRHTTLEHEPPGSRKRKLEESELTSTEKLDVSALPNVQIWTATLEDEASNPRYMPYWQICRYNPSDAVAQVSIQAGKAQPERFHVPPRSTACQMKCSFDAFSWHTRNLVDWIEMAPRFNLVVMDPPWPNTSVKRASKSGQSSYQIAKTMPELETLLIDLYLETMLAEDAIVAVWITNKPAIRDLMLSEGGLFASWNVVLEEEWLWIKTTKDGQPVTALDGMWRKPYEVLLVGRKQKQRRSSDIKRETTVRRRVIAGVPDLHSRKPCLKELIEPLRSKSDNPMTLEIFARYLVKDWWSWGNEALKFNHESHWTSPSA